MDRNDPRITELAIAFCRELSRELTPEQIREVNLRNYHETTQGICHSHDFCDANQVMLDAAAKAGIDITDAASDEQAQLVNRAWSLARATAFKLS